MAAHLGDKAAARLQRPAHAGEHRLLIAHPMERGVREYGIEFAAEGELLAVHDPGIDPAGPCRGDHVRPGIDGDHHGAGCDDLFGQYAVAAAEIEDVLTWGWREQFEDGGAEGRDEMRGLGVTLGRPALPRDFRHRQTSIPCTWRASASRRISDRVVRVVIISGSILSSMIAASLQAAASSKAGANSSVLETEAPKTP